MPFDRIVAEFRSKLLLGIYKKRFLGGVGDPMLFIITSGRSGSTLLRRMLMENYFIHIPPESSAIIENSTRLYLRRYVEPIQPAFVEALIDGVFNLEFNYWNLTRSDLSVKVQESIAKYGDLKLDQFIYSVYDLHRQRFNEDALLVGDKTPYQIYSLGILPRIFAKSKYILLVRRPEAVVASRMRELNESFEVALNRWVWASEIVLKFASNHRGSHVLQRYEDLILSPDECLRDIGDRLGIPRREEKKQLETVCLGDVKLPHHRLSLGGIVSDRNNQLLNALTGDQIANIRKVSKKYLKKLGYN